MTLQNNEEQEIATKIWQKYFGDYAFVTRDGMRPLIAREFVEELANEMKSYSHKKVLEGRKEQIMQDFNSINGDSRFDFLDESVIIRWRNERLEKLTQELEGSKRMDSLEQAAQWTCENEVVYIP